MRGVDREQRPRQQSSQEGRTETPETFWKAALASLCSEVSPLACWGLGSAQDPRVSVQVRMGGVMCTCACLYVFVLVCMCIVCAHVCMCGHLGGPSGPAAAGGAGAPRSQAGLAAPPSPLSVEALHCHPAPGDVGSCALSLQQMGYRETEERER